MAPPAGATARPCGVKFPPLVPSSTAVRPLFSLRDIRSKTASVRIQQAASVTSPSRGCPPAGTFRVPKRSRQGSGALRNAPAGFGYFRPVESTIQSGLRLPIGFNVSRRYGFSQGAAPSRPKNCLQIALGRCAPRPLRDFPPRESHQSAPGALPIRAGSPRTPVCPADQAEWPRRRVPRRSHVGLELWVLTVKPR